MDVVGEQPRMAREDAGEGGVDRPVERGDRPVRFGRRLPLMIAGRDDDRRAALRVAARGDVPAGEVEGRTRRPCGARVGGGGGHGYLPLEVEVVGAGGAVGTAGAGGAVGT